MKEEEKRLKKYQTLFDELSLKLDKCKSLKNELENLSNQFDELEKYYQKQWLLDVKKSKVIDIEITSQDAIWNLLEEKDEVFENLSEILKVKNKKKLK